MLAVAGWLLHGPLLGALVLRVLPGVGKLAGCELRAGEAQAQLFVPWVLKDVQVRRPDGTDVRIGKVRLSWDGTVHPGTDGRRWFGRLVLEEVSGVAVLFPGSKAAQEPGEYPVQGQAPAARLPWLPRTFEVRGADLEIRAGNWTAKVEGLDAVFREDRAGVVQAGSAVVRRGKWSKSFSGLQAVTAWREGTAYLADLQLVKNVTLDAVSLSLIGAPAFTVEARAFGGYVYADWTRDGGTEVKAAVNAMNLSLAEAGEFAAFRGEMEGRVGLAKLTFNGDPQQWMSSQMSVRFEAKDFAWRKNAVEDLTVGLSVAGRRVRVNEFVLRQKENRVKLRGTASLPSELSAWQEAPIELDVAAEVNDAASLAGLFGPPWSEISGGFTVEGSASGRAGDGEGWLKLRAWNLRARGIRPASLQADLVLQGRDLKLAGLAAQSGPNFLRGHGQLSLQKPLAYQGRLELRVREVARYLEPLGRFAPDWAREGGVLLFWDGDGTAEAHSGVASLELVKFTGDLNPVPVNAKLTATYSPGNIYVSRFLLDRGPLSLSSSFYFGGEGLSVQGIQLFNGRTRLLFGELFLPLSLDALLERRPWREVLLPGGDVYAAMRSDDLDLGALVALFGQETTLRGRTDLRLDARGSWSDPEANIRLSTSGLRAVFPAFALPEARAELVLQIKERKAAVDAQLVPKGSKPVTLRAMLPLHGTDGNGAWTVLDDASPWEAHLEMPPTQTDLFGWKPFGVPLAGGKVSASLQAGHTLAAPHLGGFVKWEGVDWKPSGGWTAWKDMSGRLAFGNTTATFEKAQAVLGQGTLRMGGRFDFSDPGNIGCDLTFEGSSLQLFRDDNLLVEGSPKITAKSDGNGGSVEGVWSLNGSRVLRQPVVIPQIAPATATPVAFGSPLRIAAPFLASWNLNVHLVSDAPLPLAAGSLRPDLTLQGTLGSPLLLGTVTVSNAVLEFPAGAMVTASGAVHFTKEQPWQPLLDLVGGGRVGGYNVGVGAFGPVNRGLFLTSEPSLSPEQIALMFRTGVSPEVPGQANPAVASAESEKSENASWIDTEKILGLLGWGTSPADAGDDRGFSGTAPVACEWGFR